jgi:hypothetical protein
MKFSLPQIQEKCREQNQPLYIAFIDLAKVKMLPKIGCPPKFLSIVRPFLDCMMSTVQCNSDTSTVWISAKTRGPRALSVT